MSTPTQQRTTMQATARTADRVASPWFLISVGTVQTPSNVGHHGGPS